jgi:hypothetical protein
MKTIRIEGQEQEVIEVDGKYRIAVQLCRPKWTEARELRWVIRVRPKEREYVILLCLLDRAYQRVIDFYVRLPIEMEITRIKQFGENDEWLGKATRLDDLSELYGVTKRAQSDRVEHCT